MDTESANLETNPRTITHEIHRRDRFLDSVITHHQTKRGSLTLEIQTNTQSHSHSPRLNSYYSSLCQTIQKILNIYEWIDVIMNAPAPKSIPNINSNISNLRLLLFIRTLDLHIHIVGAQKLLNHRCKCLVRKHHGMFRRCARNRRFIIPLQI